MYIKWIIIHNAHVTTFMITQVQKKYYKVKGNLMTHLHRSDTVIEFYIKYIQLLLLS